MATLHVRYQNGEEDHWEIHERLDADEVVVSLWKAWSNPLGPELFSLTVTTETGSETIDYGRIGLRMSEVVMWHIDGLLDPNHIATWQDPDHPWNQPDSPEN